MEIRVWETWPCACRYNDQIRDQEGSFEGWVCNIDTHLLLACKLYRLAANLVARSSWWRLEIRVGSKRAVWVDFCRVDPLAIGVVCILCRMLWSLHRKCETHWVLLLFPSPAHRRNYTWICNASVIEGTPPLGECNWISPFALARQVARWENKFGDGHRARKPLDQWERKETGHYIIGNISLHTIIFLTIDCGAFSYVQKIKI